MKESDDVDDALLNTINKKIVMMREGYLPIFLCPEASITT